MKNWLVLFQNCIEGEKRKPQQQLISVIFRHTYMMPGGKFGLTNGVGIPPVFCVSADKSLNFRLKHFTPIPKANDSEKTVMNSSSSVLPHYAKRERDYYYFSSKQQNAKLFTLSCEMKDRLLLQQHITSFSAMLADAPQLHTHIWWSTELSWSCDLSFFFSFTAAKHVEFWQLNAVLL